MERYIKEILNREGYILKKYQHSLPIISFLILGVVCLIMYFFYANIPTPNEIGAALGQALMVLFFVAVVFICVILPYIQTVIVLVHNHFIKN